MKLGVQNAIVSRSFLWGRIDQPKLTFCLTHLKSSADGDDLRNAMKRELGEACDSTDFPRTGPIDNIYVAGPQVQGFADARKTGETFGSDHFAVVTACVIPED